MRSKECVILVCTYDMSTYSPSLPLNMMSLKWDDILFDVGHNLIILHHVHIFVTKQHWLLSFFLGGGG